MDDRLNKLILWIEENAGTIDLSDAYTKALELQSLPSGDVSGSLPDTELQIEAEKIAIAKREKQGYNFTPQKKEFYRNGFYDAIIWMSNNR